MAGWMSNGTKGVKSRWVTIVVDRRELETLVMDGNGTSLREFIEDIGGKVYGE